MSHKTGLIFPHLSLQSNSTRMQVSFGQGNEPAIQNKTTLTINFFSIDPLLNVFLKTGQYVFNVLHYICKSIKIHGSTPLSHGVFLP